MSISLKKVSKNFNSTNVLSDVSIALNIGEKIAIVGENGAGKTTLLRLCAGIEEPSSGQIFYDPHNQACYVSQEFPVEEFTSLTGLDYIYSHGGDNLLRGVKRFLAEFDIDEAILDREINVLSGGQQKILALSVALAQRPQYLLIDEPENHLDLFARQILISLLKEYRGCVVFISHDQELINSVTNRIVEIHDGILTSYTGSYEFYLEHKARMNEGKERTWKSYEKKVEQLDRLIKRMREWVKKNPDLGPQLRARKTQLRQLQDKAPEKPREQKRAKIEVADVSDCSRRMVLIQDVKIGFDNRDLIRNANLIVRSGEKIAIVGRNGSGKTTLLKFIASRNNFPLRAGVIKVHENIKMGFFSQDSLTTLDPNETPIDVISRITRGLPEHSIRALLARYLIGAEACMRKIGTLSGGQKTRLRFCLLFAEKNDLLLLDEPTNHLDPITWEILVEALKEYEGTVLVVSHDRVFIDQIANRLITIDKQNMSEYFGTLSEYLKTH